MKNLLTQIGSVLAIVALLSFSGVSTQLAKADTSATSATTGTTGSSTPTTSDSTTGTSSSMTSGTSSTGSTDGSTVTTGTSMNGTTSTGTTSTGDTSTDMTGSSTTTPTTSATTTGSTGSSTPTTSSVTSGSTTGTSDSTTGTTASTPATVDTTTPVTIMVMQHICNSSIQSLAEFKAAGDFAHQVVACPTIALPGNTLTPNAANGGNYTFDFSLTNPANATTQTLSGGNAQFVQQKICETDANEDLNGDGIISPTTCLDISNYAFGQMSRGVTTLTQTMAPAGTRFGAMQFTPAALNNGIDDSTSLVSMNANGVTVDSTKTTDSMLMLHIYNFQNVPGTTTGTGSTVTPGTQTSISGMVVVPIAIYNAFYNIAPSAESTGTSTSSTSGSSTNSSTITYTNGYPTMNGNYYDCYGNVDNDMAHHTTNASDTDPAHHVGQNCPSGSMFASSSSGMNTGSSTSGTVTSGQMDGQYGLIPLTLANLEQLITLYGSTSGMPATM